MNWFLLPFLAVIYAGVAENPMATDKAAHFGAGYIVADVASEVKLPRWACLLSSVAIGAAKESYDLNHGGTFDLKDLAATSLGGVTQITIHW